MQNAILWRRNKYYHPKNVFTGDNNILTWICSACGNLFKTFEDLRNTHCMHAACVQNNSVTRQMNFKIMQSHNSCAYYKGKQFSAAASFIDEKDTKQKNKVNYP
ncbi:hypothetical protein XENOCAPTIV_019481 [Xenoophorus captivus]|uniref:C2H2-type domain-containing protein n=1 Tax=Xenoophorus captivus TaxID=1517983 RepID=A0ABV0Q5H2_9TELE